MRYADWQPTGAEVNGLEAETELEQPEASMLLEKTSAVQRVSNGMDRVCADFQLVVQELEAKKAETASLRLHVAELVEQVTKISDELKAKKEEVEYLRRLQESFNEFYEKFKKNYLHGG